MSFVGKLLVVLQVLLSVCFMAFAGAVFATHTNWKTEAEQTQEELALQRQSYQTLNTKFDQLQADAEKQVNEMQKERDSLTARVQTLESENNDHKARQNEHENHAAVAQEQTRIALKEAQHRTAEASALRKENAQIIASRHEELQERLRLEVALKEEQEKVAMLNESLKSQLRDIAALKSMLRLNNLSDDPDESLADRRKPPQAVEGRVTRIRKDRRGIVDMLEINIGSDDGLLKGHKLSVYRGGKYLGEVRIREVQPDVAVADVLSRAKTGLIKEGDNVTTKL